MTELNVKLPKERLEALRRYADQRQTQASELIEDYIEHLLAGGRPVSVVPEAPPSAAEITALAERGGSFDWLADEPDLYGEDDGEADDVTLTCEDFHRIWGEYGRSSEAMPDLGLALQAAFAEHLNTCTPCGDWYQGQIVLRRGVDISDYPCVYVAYRVTATYTLHPDPFDCPDAVIVGPRAFGRYGMPVRDGTTSIIVISHCPWCGIGLP